MPSPDNEKNILNALATITQVGTGISPSAVYVNNRYRMSLGDFPAIQITSGAQTHVRQSTYTYDGAMQAIVEICDKWDTQPNTIDDIYTNLAAIAKIVKDNIQNNDNLTVGTQPNATSIPRIQISPYRGDIDDSFPGLTLIVRTLTLSVNILPYESF